MGDNSNRKNLVRKIYQMKMPDWFPPMLAAAQHQDKINTWPWYGRIFHRWIVARKCPACIYWNTKGLHANERKP